MSDVVATSPMQYLDRATRALQGIGIAPPQAMEAPIAGLLEKITALDEDRIVIIARTLGQTSVFNEVVREQVQAMEIGERYRQITESFNSIRDDTKKMVDQLEDQKIDLFERINNVWMKLSRGDVADRFDEIRQVYLDVTRSTKDQIQREQVILDAYRDFRGALKHAEVMALEVLRIAEQRLEGAQAQLQKASDAVANFTGQEVSERARLELARDEQLRRTQDEEKRYQIAKDLSDNLTIGYNTSEVVMARLMQMTNAKERVYAQAVTFFSTNDSVFTALKASFTGMFGLNESTQTLNEMKEGVSRSLEVLAEIGDQVGEAAVRAGYGPTIRADAVKKLVESVITFQERSQEIIGEMRQLATRNSAEIRDAVEEGKRRIARLVAEGQALPANG
ncbi:cell surface protein [Bradyrhizobium sp. IC3069]|uniref:cell surface protein n=1 Tax=unclassified Bradyrhizobium TaxID=2631580 RepID=UPI001CD70F56|nr:MULTISPECIES: cell surface protein [unclassified Bradyrhizobium]MCA1365007.1 cell surface protein [Bradyrhizobium sp. IC4059]MCA1522672.1 cell surface protein [Bradyrhizobium sp. IC3069]